jgi:hypothetical protein
MTASIRHHGVISRYIDTNTDRRAACNQWLEDQAGRNGGDADGDADRSDQDYQVNAVGTQGSRSQV